MLRAPPPNDYGVCSCRVCPCVLSGVSCVGVRGSRPAGADPRLCLMCQVLAAYFSGLVAWPHEGLKAAAQRDREVVAPSSAVARLPPPPHRVRPKGCCLISHVDGAATALRGGLPNVARSALRSVNVCAYPPARSRRAHRDRTLALSRAPFLFVSAVNCA